MALEFNGSTQSIQVTDDASLKGFSAMSLCWRSYAASYNNDGFITKINDAADIRDYTTLRGGGYPRLYIGNGSNVSFSPIKAPSPIIILLSPPPHWPA